MAGLQTYFSSGTTVHGLRVDKTATAHWLSRIATCTSRRFGTRPFGTFLTFATHGQVKTRTANSSTTSLAVLEIVLVTDLIDMTPRCCGRQLRGPLKAETFVMGVTIAIRAIALSCAATPGRPYVALQTILVPMARLPQTSPLAAAVACGLAARFCPLPPPSFLITLEGVTRF